MRNQAAFFFLFFSFLVLKRGLFFFTKELV